MEACLKFARRYWFTQGVRGRTRFVAFEHGFSGRTMGALSVTANPHYREPFEPLIPGVTFVPPGDIAALDAAVSSATAAIVVEPIQGEGGVRPISAEFAQAIEDACTRTGALLIADEVQCGLGRTGAPFYFQTLGLTPDLVTVGKALGAGVPVGAALVADEVAAQVLPGDHGTTYGGNLLATRAALFVLEQLQDHGLLAQVQRTGPYFEAAPAGARRHAPGDRRSAGRRPDARPAAHRGRRAGGRRGAGARTAREPHRRDGGAPAAAVHGVHGGHRRGGGDARCRVGRSASGGEDEVNVDLVTATGQAPAPFHPAMVAEPVTFEMRSARTEEAGQIHALIQEHLEEGHLLPRGLDELTVRAGRFVVAVAGDRVVACAELAPLSGRVAEVRSLVVHRDARHEGLGKLLVHELMRRARVDGFDTLCAFTHGPGFFVRLGFSIVPAPLGPREDPRRLPELPAVPHLRPARRRAVAPRPAAAGAGVTPR